MTLVCRYVLPWQSACWLQFAVRRWSSLARSSSVFLAVGCIDTRGVALHLCHSVGCLSLHKEYIPLCWLSPMPV